MWNLAFGRVHAGTTYVITIGIVNVLSLDWMKELVDRTKGCLSNA